ncbi:MAG TPA: DUF1918 domain-containing protein [Nonomuraea sp.]|nr:DUF1918 domain-containing protein [Nonomuraea sp.]
MKATVGDRLVLEGTRGDSTRRKGLIVEVSHTDGSPPYLVRWLDNGHKSLIFPRPDARILHAAHRSQALFSGGLLVSSRLEGRPRAGVARGAPSGRSRAS